MNKIKVLYDVVEALKKQDTVTGKKKVVVLKDDARVFAVETAFEKPCGKGMGPHGMRGHFGHHGMHGCYGPGQGAEFEKAQNGKGGRHHGRDNGQGYPGKLDKVSFMLDALNRLEIKDGENGFRNIELALPLSALPKSFKDHVVCRREGHGNPPLHRGPHFFKGHGFMGRDVWSHFSDFDSLDDMTVLIKGKIDAEDNLIETTLLVEGAYKSEDAQIHKVQVKAEMTVEK